METASFRPLFVEKKVCVLVPTYNNEQTLEKVLYDVLLYTDAVIVVNDGSTDSTPGILSKFPGIELVSYERNKGKGYALRQGFMRAVEKGYDYAISIDSDGQHFADDLPKFLFALAENPSAVIIGARNMGQSSVPGKSSFGNKFSNFWFWVETGLKMQDTQSGYRLYPVKQLSSINFISRKFEFEIEVLVRAAWNGLEIVHVPVRVFYPEKGKRVSHFRPFKDFLRISVLNTVLVTIALLYIKPRDLFRSLKKKNFRDLFYEHLFNPNESDAIKALSVGFGVFMGIVPIWGFQLATAIALSFLFRLNKALVIIAANISIPPMIPLILFLSYQMGALWRGEQAEQISFSSEITLDTVKSNLLQYVLGAVSLAIAAGVIFGGLTYTTLKVFKRSKT
jgi:glycosyltransferase involved in cell wall biosynthesis